MDHKVSKDMISSGMTPSGEKTQADLGRTQYGSAPSPSKLMDAYKSMYGNKEEVINEMAGKGMGMTPAPKPGGITPYKDPKKVALPTPQDPATSKPQKDFIKARMSDSPAPKTETKPETKSMVDTVRDRRKEVVSARREKVQGIMNKYGESVDLLAAYRAVYEHHKKDADGNTIPHEDEEVNEGKIPAGLQAYLDKKKGKKEDKKEMKEGAGLYANIHAKRKRGGKMRKKGDKGAPSSQDFANAAKTAKEEVDKFDIVFNHFISEGYSEKEAYSKMANLTEEQLDEFLKALAQAGMRGAESIGRATRPLVAKAAQRGSNIGKPASQRIEVTDPKPQARKPFEPKRKPFDAKKPEQKPVTSASEVVSAALSKRREEKQQRKDKLASDPKTRIDIKKKEVMQDEYQYIDEYAQLAAKAAAMLSKVKKVAKPVVDATKKTIGNVAKDPTVKNIATQTAVGSMMSGGNPKKQTTGTVSASADLFDIVKGQLLDEGLSEEEIQDIMLTLTPDEIMKEMNQGPSTPVKNYGDSPDKPKILPNFGATRAKVRTTEKGTVIKGGKDTGATPTERQSMLDAISGKRVPNLKKEEYKNFDPKNPDPKQVAAQAKQEKNRQKFNDPMGVKNKNIGGQGLDPMDK